MHHIFCQARPVQDLAVLARQSDRPGSLEQSSSKMPGNQPRQVAQLRGNRKNQKSEKMVASSRTNRKLIDKVAEIYNWLDLQICNNSNLTGQCDLCGKCCDFNTFDHYLFVTPPEIRYLIAKIGTENIKPMYNSICPYNVDGKCHIYEHRFASCRIFFCKAEVNFQSRLTESAIRKLKLICTNFQIPYRYCDLETALNNFHV